jgi:Mg-chelatase subunit ChlD
MTIRKLLGVALLLGAAAGLAHGAQYGTAKPAPQRYGVLKPAPQQQTKPRVEVVFCLDTTGSMGGLIDAAKQKIWAICNQIASGQPSPELKVGLVGFRDRGDDYITKTFDLDEDLDTVHGHLMAFQAAGGGDEPESVNEALHTALNNISWSQSSNVLRIIYLVGDAPPHMDYQNDVPYKVTCRKAVERGIIINTIQCGQAASTTQFWKDIARKADGRFVMIAQDGGVQTVSTPYDKRLAEINCALAQTAVLYGDAPTQANAASNMLRQCAPVNGAPSVSMTSALPPGAAPATCAPMPCYGVTEAAERGAYCARTGTVGAVDLVQSIKDGKVKLEDVKTAELPPEMQKLTLADRKAYLAKVEAERAKLQAEARELDRERTEFLRREMSRGGATGFDGQVLEMLRDQAKKVNIAY